MKNISISPRIALLALALGTAGIPAFAQTTPTPAPVTSTAPAATDTGKHDHEAVLTADEKAHLDKIRAQVLAANPALQTEADSLKAQHKALKSQGANASSTDKAALKTLAKEHYQKLELAMLKADPTVQPILAKLKAAHKEKKNASANA